VNTVTIAGDNLAHKELYADVGKRIGSVTLGAMITPADTSNSDISKAEDFTLRIPFTTATRTIYAVLETTTAFTPISASQFTLIVTVDQN
jgi:hypothetical protein